MELKDIEKLPLHERLKKLEELEKNIKEQKKKIDKIKDETIDELSNEEKTKQVEIPKIQQIDISKLFYSEDGLEASVNVQHIPSEEELNIEYMKIFEGLTDSALYDRVDLNEKIPLEKIEGLINTPKYTSISAEQDKKQTASKGIVDDIKKYTMG